MSIDNEHFETIGELYCARFHRLRPGKAEARETGRSSSDDENVAQFSRWIQTEAIWDATAEIRRLRTALSDNEIYGGDAARTRAPENAHPEGGQNKSGQSVADSATAPPPLTHRPLCPTCHGRRRIPFSGPVDCPECVGPLTPYGEQELDYQREQASHFHKRMLEMKCALEWILQEAEFCRPDDAGPATTRIADRARKVLGNSMGEALARRESCI